MAWEKRVVWSEGMLLQPQHFQQNARFHEAQLRNVTQLCQNSLWGMATIEIDKSQLKQGKLSLNQISGMLPDGSYFDAPEIDGLPNALDINESHLNQTIYLASTIRRYGNTEISREIHANDVSRLRIEEYDFRDVSSTGSLKQTLEVAGYNFCLLTDADVRDEYDCIAIAVIDDISANGEVSLKNEFVGPTVNIKQNLYLRSFVGELVNLAQHRVSSLAARVSVAGKASTSEVQDFLMLQALNKTLPMLKHLDAVAKLTPMALYEFLIVLIGELSTFIKPDKMPPDLPSYKHKELTEVFSILIQEVRQSFSVVLEQNSINIPLQEKKYGIRVGVVADKSLFTTASFILAVHSDLSPEEMRQYFSPQVKIGAVEQIKELVNVQLPGIQLNSLAVAPREIPYQRNFVYFELVPKGEYWQALAQSGGIAIHVGSNFPNLSIELWAIRGNQE
ncbi:type VI secretion system baseplate subunit TssK [Colwellia sp. MEBiC06753]